MSGALRRFRARAFPGDGGAVQRLECALQKLVTNADEGVAMTHTNVTCALAPHTGAFERSLVVARLRAVSSPHVDVSFSDVRVDRPVLAVLAVLAVGGFFGLAKRACRLRRFSRLSRALAVLARSRATRASFTSRPPASPLAISGSARSVPLDDRSKPWERRLGRARLRASPRPCTWAARRRRGRDHGGAGGRRRSARVSDRLADENRRVVRVAALHVAAALRVAALHVAAALRVATLRVATLRVVALRVVALRVVALRVAVRRDAPRSARGGDARVSSGSVGPPAARRPRRLPTPW